MAQNQVTSIDVAKLAGVSQPTVSRAFDPDGSVAPETRLRVMAAARKLGYEPNVIARSLSTQRSNIVGIVMANLTSSLFYPNVLDALTIRLQALGKQSLLFNAPPDRPVDEILPLVLGYQVDALVIVSTTPSTEIINESARNGTPVILFNRSAPGTAANVVSCDNMAGGQVAADLLLDAGHQRIAFLAGIASTATNRMREKGFIDRLRERGYTSVQMERGAYTYESGYSAARRLLDRKEPPDAIFCAADIMALGALDVARYELGIAVPDELSIVGFDDIPIAAYPAYDLTTIRQPVDQMIDTAVSIIMSTTENVPTEQSHLLPGELIIRGSTRSI